MAYKTVVLKKVFILFFIGFAIQSAAQNKDYLIDMNGIGTLKIGMSQAEVEKMLNQKFVLRNALDTAVSHHDTATAKYKNSNVQLFFQRQYTAENIYSMYLMGLKTKSTLCKTETGISIGSDKLKIIAAYETDFVSMRPEYEDEEQSVKSKTKFVITIINDSGERRMAFYLRNNRTEAIEVMTVFNDEE